MEVTFPCSHRSEAVIAGYARHWMTAVLLRFFFLVREIGDFWLKCRDDPCTTNIFLRLTDSCRLTLDLGETVVDCLIFNGLMAPSGRIWNVEARGLRRNRSWLEKPWKRDHGNGKTAWLTVYLHKW